MIDVHNLHDALAHLRAGRAVTACGIGGKVTVKLSDVYPGRWLCVFNRPNELVEATYPNVAGVHLWLREFWKRLLLPSPRGGCRPKGWAAQPLYGQRYKG